MQAVFADTCFFFAICNPRDDLHPKAKELYSLNNGAQIVTSDLVLVELLNLASNCGSDIRQVAVGLIGQLNGTIEIVPFSSANFRQSMSFYDKHNDKGWSLTDCDSMQTMRRMGIAEVLTHDHHFEQAGFRALLRTSSQ